MHRTPRPAPAAAPSLRLVHCAGLLAALALLSGCGGGSKFAIDLDRETLAFQAVAGDEAPPAAVEMVVHFKGDGLLVGWPADTTPPDWISVSATDEGNGQVRLLAFVAWPLPAGRREATLRLITGRADGSDYLIRDVPIIYVVGQGLRAGAPALAFSSPEGTAPAAKVLALTTDLPVDSWRVEVEVPPGEEVGWISLPAASGGYTGGAAQVQVAVTPWYGGSHAATLAIRDAGGTVRARVPVTYEVAGEYALDGTPGAAVTERASLASLGVPLILRPTPSGAAGAATRWTITSDVPWLTVTPSSGDLSASVPLVARLDPDRLWALANGRHQARLSIQMTGGTARSRVVRFTLDLALQPALVVPQTMLLKVRGDAPPGDLASQVTVGNNLGEAFAAHGGWRVSGTEPWLDLSPTSRPGPGPLTLAIRPAAVAGFTDSTYWSTLTIQPDDARLPAATALAQLDLQLATVLDVTPHAAFVGQAGQVVLRGYGFGTRPTIAVSVGGQLVEGRVVSEGEIRVVAPAQAAAGAALVTVPNGLALARPGADLAVLPVPGYTATAVTLPGGKYWGQVVLDPERQAVLVTGALVGGFQRFRFADGAWSQEAAALACGDTVAVSADGRELLTACGDNHTDVTVTRLDPVDLRVLGSRSGSTFPGRFDRLAPFADGTALVVNTDQWAYSFSYPTMRPVFLDVWGAMTMMTRDRTRLLLHGSMDSSILAVGQGQVAESHALAAVPGFSREWSVSGDGSRLVVGGTVYDRAFTAIGQIAWPVEQADAVAVTPDGARAYGLYPNAAGDAWVLGRADIGAAAGPYAVTPVALPTPLDWSVRTQVLEVSDDGGALFLIAQSKTSPETTFRVLPLP